MMRTWVCAALLAGACDVGGFNPFSSEAEPEAVVASDPVPEAELDRFAGSYAFAGGKKQRAALIDAIDDLVQSFNALMRGMARDKLIETNPVYDAVSIERNGNQVSLRFDDLTHVCNLDGSATTVKGHDGGNVTCHLRVKGNALIHEIRGKRGGRVNTFTRDGNRLKLKVRIYSKLMPKDLRYGFTFKPT